MELPGQNPLSAPRLGFGTTSTKTEIELDNAVVEERQDPEKFIKHWMMSPFTKVLSE